MKTQIITALSIAAVLGAAGSAYAINQSVLTTASTEETVIGSATPVLVPVEPKGSDIPDEYRQRLDEAAATKSTPVGTVVSSSPTTSTPAASGDDSYGDDSYDDDSYEDDEDEGDEDEHEDEGDEHGDDDDD